MFSHFHLQILVVGVFVFCLFFPDRKKKPSLRGFSLRYTLNAEFRLLFVWSESSSIIGFC